MSTRPLTPPPNPQQPAPNHPAPSPARSPLTKRPKPSSSTTIPQPKSTMSTSASTSSHPPATTPDPTTNQPTTTTTTTKQPTKPTQPPTNTTTPTTHLSDAPPLLVKKLTATARAPTRGSAFAAGYDVYASAATRIPARGKGLVETGLAVAVPAGTYGRIAPRSGLAAKNFIDTGAGVIDADYRGQVKVLLFNHSEVDFEVKEGDRVAQLVLERIYTPEVVEVEELEESVRGAGGFGSTG